MKTLTSAQRVEAHEILQHLTPDTFVPRRQLAAILTVLGRPITADSLAYLRADGPPVSYFGKHSVYRWADAIAWAEARTRPATV